MIKIHFGKEHWTIIGHGPKYICFCVSRMCDLIAIENWERGLSKDPPGEMEQEGFTSLRAPRGSLGRAAKRLFESLAMNRPRYVKVEYEKARRKKVG